MLKIIEIKIMLNIDMNMDMLSMFAVKMRKSIEKSKRKMTITQKHNIDSGLKGQVIYLVAKTVGQLSVVKWLLGLFFVY
jgi:hypothetical protein